MLCRTNPPRTIFQMDIDRFNQFRNLSPEEKLCFQLLRKQYEEAYPWVANSKHKEPLHNFMMIFLRSRKLKVESAFQKLAGIHNSKLKYPEIFDNMRPNFVADKLKHWQMLVLKAPDKNGGTILVIKTGTFDPKYGEVEDVLSIMGFLMLHLHQSKVVQHKGITFIVDFAGMGWRIARVCGPSKIYKSVELLLTSVPYKINGFHSVNGSSIANGLFHAFKTLCPKKLADRFHIHSSPESLHTELSPDDLPVCLGGMLTDAEACQEEYKNLDLLSTDVNKYYEDTFQQL